MSHTIWSVFWRIIAALFVAAVAAYLFHAVLPPSAADVAGLAAGVVVVAAGLGKGSGFLMKLGEVVLSWPIVALALQYGGIHDRGVRIGLAAAVAAAVGLLAQRHGNGRETKRLLTVLAACAIPLYAMLHALVSGDECALVAACCAVAVSLGTISMTQVLPDRHRDAIVTSFLIVVGAGVFAVLRTMV